MIMVLREYNKSASLIKDPDDIIHFWLNEKRVCQMEENPERDFRNQLEQFALARTDLALLANSGLSVCPKCIEKLYTREGE